MKIKATGKKILTFISFLMTAILTHAQNNHISIYAEKIGPRLQFAVDEITDVLAVKNLEVLVTDEKPSDIIFEISASKVLKPQGFSLQREPHHIIVLATDTAGLMYGGLELAEQIGLYGLDGIRAMIRNPYMELRGTKFNIPLDVRTPSYSDPCDAAQKNIPEMWDIAFWKEYLDNLARYRYNFVSLWSLHPFPSLVKVPGYEDVALADVHRSAVKWKEYYNRNGIGFDAPEILANPEIIKEISIEKKIAFWREVMSYAKDRNIDFYVVTWNIFVYGTDGKYGITDDVDNPVSRDYFRKSIKQMFVTYPHLTGIGLTTGENMHGVSTEEKEDWAYDTYGQGLLDAAEEIPNRKFTFIHRQHQTGALEIARKFQALVDHENIDFIFSFKYAKAHVFSATTQPYHQEFVNEITGMKTIWTLRNDDVYQYRWGAPDFVREFIQNIPLEVSRGFYYGSDQWIWGREFLMREADSPREIEITKHWYHWLLWGRLGYDPTITNDRFIDMLQARFQDIDAAKLFSAWQEASMIYPTTTGFHWGPLDFHWYIEACKGHPDYAQNETGFHDVNRFINLPPHPRSGFQSIPDFVKMQISHDSSNLISPFQVAERLEDQSSKALAQIEELDPHSSKELQFTLGDIRTMALLGSYYASKIRGSTHLALYRTTKNKEYQKESVAHLRQALETWKKYVDSARQQNTNPLWLNRVGYVDWSEITKWVEQDILLASAEVW